MNKKVLQTVLVSGLIAAQVVLQFPTVVYAESGEEVQTEVVSTSGATEGTSGATEGTSGADEGTSVSNEGTSGADEGTSVSSEGTSGATEGTSGADEGTSGSTDVSAEGSESNEAAGGTTTEGSESESSDSNEANTGESSESSEGTSGSVGENSGDTSDTSKTGSTESAELTYKVTFKDSLDETFEVVVEVEENASAEAPEAPEHEGYAFVEWDADFSSVTEDMTVTAQYEEVVATPVLRSPLRSPAGGTSPAFNQTYDDVTIEAAEGVIPDGAYFVVGMSPNHSKIYDSIFAKYDSSRTRHMGNTIKSITLFDNTGNAIQPNGSVTITVTNNSMTTTLPFDKYTKAIALYIDDANNFTELNCTNKGNGTVSFETDHFSDYGVVYIAEIYTVTFDSKGGSPVSSSRVQKGATYMTMPANPTKADATFDGWYKDEDCTIPFDRSEAINSDMTLYAKWRQNTYSVTYVVPSYFNVNLNFDAPTTIVSGNNVISVNSGDLAYKPSNSAVLERGIVKDLASYMAFNPELGGLTVKEEPRVGYTDPHPGYTYILYGWYKDAAYTIPYDFTEPVTENITLYAKTDKIPLAFGTVIDFYFDYGYNKTMQKIGRIDETGSRWYPDTSWGSSHIVKKKLYYAKWVEDPDPTQMVRIPSPFSSNAVRGKEGVDSGYKMYFFTQASEQIAPEGYLASSQMYPGTVAVFFRYLFKDDSSPVPPVTPVQPSNPTPTPSDDPTPNPSEDPTPSVSPTPSVEPTETPSPTVSPSVSPAPSATPSPTVKPSAKPTQKPDSEDDEEDESGVLSSTHEVMDLVAEEVKEGSLTYVESNQFGFSRAYTLRYLNLDGKVKRVVNTKEV